MQLFGPTGTRNDFIDRNPFALMFSGTFTAVGGSNFDLFAYQVPAGRKALIYSYGAYMLVSTALAAGQVARLLARVTNTLPATFDQQAIHFIGAAAVGSRDRFDGGSVFVEATDGFAARVITGAGAGVVEVQAGFSGVEYDA